MERKATSMRVGLVVGVALACAASAWCEIRRVPQDYATIQAAIDAAVPGADEVVIADGVYSGAGNRDLDFCGKVLIVRSEAGDPAACIIDCAASGRGFWFQSDESADSIVQGVTIRNGYADFGGGVYCLNSSPKLMRCVIIGNTANCGGGLYCFEASPTVVDCVVSDNLGAYGSGVGCSTNACPTLVNCLLSGNANGDFGGGIDCYESNPTLVGCTITNNIAHYGGGGVNCYHSSARLSNCTIADNTGGQFGGGVYCRYDSRAVLTNCLISGNTSNYYGGGVHCEYSSPTLIGCTIAGNSSGGGGGVDCLPDSDPLLVRCMITGNIASQNGGGVGCYQSSPTLVSCLISGNIGAACGGVYCDFEANPTLGDCTVSGNTGYGLYCRYASSPRLSNCILWADAEQEIYAEPDGSAPLVTYCDIQGGYVGAGNIDADPLFTDATGGDFRLLTGSPCIDTGDPGSSIAPEATDLDGKLRIWDGDGDGTARIDMGAYEFGSFGHGDLNCDGAINAFDIDPFVLALTDAAGYAAEFSDCDLRIADTNGDGAVNAFDIDSFVGLLAGK